MGWPRDTSLFPEPTPWNGDVPADYEDEEPNDGCTDPGGHEWACTGTAYGGDDESYFGEGRCYCVHCGADGDA